MIREVVGVAQRPAPVAPVIGSCTGIPEITYDPAISGSVGTGSYIVRGRAHEDAYRSASHGAARKTSRGAAKRMFTVEDLQAQTEGVVCRKDADVIDEIPGAYKDLETVMSEQRDLVDVEARLRTIL